MSFTTPVFDPVTGMKDTAAFPERPANQTDARDQFQGMFDQCRDMVQALIDELEATTADASGAHEIGSAAISGVTGSTVYAQLASLKGMIDALVAVSVPDGSIDDDKLATDVKVGSLAALTTTEKSSIQGAINELVTSLGTLSSTVAGLSTPTIGTANITNGAVTEAKIAAGAVTNAKIADYSVGSSKLGALSVIPLDTGDYLIYSTPTNEISLLVSGCTSAVPLAPVLFGTSATPPAGTYPRGTLYIQYS